MTGISSIRALGPPYAELGRLPGHRQAQPSCMQLFQLHPVQTQDKVAQ